MTHPRDLQAAGAVRAYTYVNLTVYGRRTIGACIGILFPRVVLDRAMETEPGFEALCYHEGTHAYEFHRLTSILLLAPGVASLSVGIVYEILPLALGVLLSVAGWIWWQREMEIRADAVALFGAGEKEFWALVQRVGAQRTWWGRWCYGKTKRAREARAWGRCRRRGWTP